MQIKYLAIKLFGRTSLFRLPCQLLLITLAALLPPPVLASYITFDVQPRKVMVGEVATATFSVHDADNPAPPPVVPVNGLQIAGPSRQASSSINIINGVAKADNRVEFSYRIVPMKTGSFQLGPYAYNIGNEVINLAPIELQALSAEEAAATKDQANNDQQALFAKMAIDKAKVYDQEVFDLYLYVYSHNVNVGGSIELIGLPGSGLSIQPFEEINPDRELINNTLYEVHRFRGKAQALTSGTFTLEPILRIPVVVQQNNQRRQGIFDDPFFAIFGGGGAIQPVDVRAEPIKINVSPLPEDGKPANFNGAVGQFLFDAGVKPSEGEVGQPMVVSSSISGVGNIDKLMPPAIPASEDFKVYEVRRVENGVNPSKTLGKRVFEQVIIPKSTTPTNVPSLSFSFFNPQSGTYISLTKGPFPIKISPSSQSPAKVIQGGTKASGGEAATKILGSDIAYLMPPPAHWEKQGHYRWYLSWLFWVIQLIPLATVIVIFLSVRKKADLERDVAKARRLRAPRRARAGLRKAELALANSNRAEFFDGLWEALNSYYADRLNLAPGEVTSDIVLEAVKRGGLDPETATSLEGIYKACEQERFGYGNHGPKDITSSDHSLWSNWLKMLPDILKTSDKIKLTSKAKEEERR